MKLLKYLISGVITVLLIISINSCKPDKNDCFDPTNPACVNYDPCYGQKPVTADIELTQRADIGTFSGDSIVYIEDSIFPKSEIRFRSPLNGAKYTWTLGAETITSQTFVRNFYGSSVPFGEYSVKLVVEKDANRNCFPADNGMDTITKKFKIVPLCNLAIFGIFKGKWDNLPNDSSLISLRSFEGMNYKDSCGVSLVRLTNRKGTNDTILAPWPTISNSRFINYRPNSIELGNADFRINTETKTVLFDYYIGTTHYVFRGRKISN